MTSWEAITLGIVQGLTEFLPVSSSGHLMIMQALLGMQKLSDFLLFDLICHLGTLFAIFAYFAKRILALLTTDHKTLLAVIVATLPLFGAVLFLPLIEKLFDSPSTLWPAFFYTGTILLLSDKYGRDKPPELLQQQRWRNAFLIGCSQCIALTPGISRSGSTIATGRLLGLHREEAATFSFLMAIPAILGAVTLEIAKIFFKPEMQQAVHIDLLQYSLGFITSFVVGYASLAAVIRIVMHDALKYFAWYCFAVGIFCLVYFVILP